MDYKKREEIFSKEALHISDVQKLFGCAKSTASNLIQGWKRKIQFSGKELRLTLDGRIHIMDYFDVMNINGEDPGERYFRRSQKKNPQASGTLRKERRLQQEKVSACRKMKTRNKP